MAKEPLITRSELRKQQEKLEKKERQQNARLDREWNQTEKKISKFYRKENQKQKELTRTRSGEKEKSRRINHFLMKAILIVSLVLLVVIWMIFYL